MSIPVLFLNSSPANWGALPMPAGMNVNLPGAALARAIRSAPWPRSCFYQHGLSKLFSHLERNQAGHSGSPSRGQ